MKHFSEWYALLGDHTFPLVFVPLSSQEKALILGQENDAQVRAGLSKRLEAALSRFPGKCFVGTDACAPTDAPGFLKNKAVSNAASALSLLSDSTKVKASLEGEKTPKLVVKPYRRMDKTREFRLFIQGRKLVGMSQYCLERQFRRLEGRREELWQKADEFVNSIKDFLPEENLVCDIYFCSNGETLIVDFNKWGDTSPLLFKKWDHDFNEKGGLRLMAPPMKLGGDVKVSF